MGGKARRMGDRSERGSGGLGGGVVGGGCRTGLKGKRKVQERRPSKSRRPNLLENGGKWCLGIICY